MLTSREYFALLIAGLWDVAQVLLLGATVAAFLAPLSVPLSLLLQLAGATIVSLLLALLLSPHWALLPVFVLENTPMV